MWNGIFNMKNDQNNPFIGESKYFSDYVPTRSYN